MKRNRPDGGQELVAGPLSERMNVLRQRESQVFLGLSLVIGAVTGLAVVAFIVLTERMGMRLYPVVGAPWRRLMFPVVGSLGIGYLLYRFFPNARGSGVPQTKAALFARDGRITLRTVLGKFFCTSATLASGIPLGREGPSVQVGAGIGSVLGRALGLSTEQVKNLIPVGAAAAIAAAFNTPLAAVVFALEEIMGDLNAPMMGGVVLASATAWVVLRLSLGDHPLFNVPRYHLVSSAEFAVYAVLGVAGGVVSAAFSWLLLNQRARFLRFPQKTVWFQPVVGGLLVGGMGWFVPQVLGVGYGFVGDALNGRMAFHLMLLLLVLKLFAVTTSYASGNAGGIFGPSLFLGAMLGGVVGTAAHHLFPLATASARGLCAGGHGCGLRWRGAHPHDLGAHHLRDDPGLRRHRSPDDRQHGQPLRRLPPAAWAHLRGAGRAGRHPSAQRQDAAASRAAHGRRDHESSCAFAGVRNLGARGPGANPRRRPANRPGHGKARSHRRRHSVADGGTRWTRTPAGCSTTSSPLPSFPTCTPIRGSTWPWSAWEATRSICCRWSAAPIYTRWSAS